MDELQRQAAELRALGDKPATPERRALVIQALHCKFEGVQSVALRVLGRWGDAESIAAIRSFLNGAFDRKSGWAIRGVACDALLPQVHEEDVDWVLGLYFGLPEVVMKHELVRLVVALPVQKARHRLVAELRSADPNNRQAAVKAIGNMPFPDREQLLSSMRDDPHPFVSKSARLLLARA
jgi:HEAT repeat protein